MLRSLTSSDPRFRTVNFRPGVNLLKADVTQGSRDADTRNSVGKSSLIELVHFLLGASADKRSLAARAELRGFFFYLTLDWSEDERVRVSRRGAEPSVIHLEFLSLLDDAVTQSLDVSLSDWQRLIEQRLFGLEGEHPGISGRAMLSFLARRISANAFNEPTRFYPRQSAADGTANLAYLLGLDWSLAASYRDLSEREASRRALRQAATGPLFGRLVGSAADLRGQILVAEERVSRLRSEIDAFKVVPRFEELQTRADEIAVQILQSRESDAADRRNLADIDRSLSEAVAARTDPRLEAVIEQLSALLNKSTHERFSEVAAFHESVIRNRQRYLEREATETRRRLEDRQAERDRWNLQLSSLMAELQAGGALEQLLTLQAAYARELSALESLRSRFEAASALEASRAEITRARVELQTAISADLDDRSSIVRDATVLFSTFASRLYEGSRNPYLEFEGGTSSLEIRPHIDTDDGRGVGNMVIFCFDLTVAVIARRRGRGPDFLMHDSHLFDGVDARQIARAFLLAREVCRDEKIQYVMSLNSDDVDKVIRRGGSLDPDIRRLLEGAVIEPVLTDASEAGGLFGFRFDTGSEKRSRVKAT